MQRLHSAFSEAKKCRYIHTLDTRTETACLKLIFTKFASSMRKEVARHIHAYRHKKHWRTIFPEDVFVLACCVVKLVVEWWKFESLLTFGFVFCVFVMEHS